MAHRSLLPERRGVFSDSATGFSIVRTLRGRRWQTKEAGSRPVRSRDLFGDLGQGRISCPRILVSVFGHGDGMSTATPFAYETRARFQAEARHGPNPAGLPQGPSHGLQPTAGRLADPPVFDFLPSVTQRAGKEG